MSATIIHLPFPTHFYAELWCAERFLLEPNALWWPSYPLPAEEKADERHIGASFKCDIIDACWIALEGTAADGTRILQTQRAASGDAEILGRLPGAGFLPIRAGVNLIVFGESPAPEPDTEPPAPGPELDPAPDGWTPDTITFYGASVAEPLAVRWGDRDLVYTVPRAWVVEAFQGSAAALFERVRGLPYTRRERG